MTIRVSTKTLTAVLLVCLVTALGLLANLSQAVPDKDGRNAIDNEIYQLCIDSGGGEYQCTAYAYVCLCSSTTKQCTGCQDP